ncbi:MAG TPA: ribosome-associated translation inhibitor RaiA, partial [Massilibacterium sp.]|nr:ribosome-associated translation inhibitor RaiA [Massilibacterium sp.]
MLYNIRGENIEVTDALRDYVEKKVGKLERYFDTPPRTDVNVNLKVYNDKTQKVEVTIPMPHLLLRAEETHTDMYAAIDLVVDKLERQIRKHKTKVNRKARQEGALKYAFAQIDNGKTEEEDIQIYRTKRFNLKPMNVEEAVLQMEMLG